MSSAERSLVGVIGGVPTYHDIAALSGSVFLDLSAPDCHVIAYSSINNVFREFDRRENEAAITLTAMIIPINAA